MHLFLTVYLALFVISCLLLSLEHTDLVTTFTAVASCMNNIGPGLEIVGPMGNFSSFSYASKLLLSFDMLAGGWSCSPCCCCWRRLSGNASCPLCGADAKCAVLATARFPAKSWQEICLYF